MDPERGQASESLTPWCFWTKEDDTVVVLMVVEREAEDDSVAVRLVDTMKRAYQMTYGTVRRAVAQDNCIGMLLDVRLDNSLEMLHVHELCHQAEGKSKASIRSMFSSLSIGQVHISKLFVESIP